MLANLRGGKSEDGRKSNLSPEDKAASIDLWNERRLRIIYSVANCAISQKVGQHELEVMGSFPAVPNSFLREPVALTGWRTCKNNWTEKQK